MTRSLFPLRDQGVLRTRAQQWKTRGERDDRGTDVGCKLRSHSDRVGAPSGECQWGSRYTKDCKRRARSNSAPIALRRLDTPFPYEGLRALWGGWKSKSQTCAHARPTGAVYRGCGGLIPPSRRARGPAESGHPCLSSLRLPSWGLRLRLGSVIMPASWYVGNTALWCGSARISCLLEPLQGWLECVSDD